MNRKDYILFDLDGTLTDPKEGITKSVQHALAHFGIQTDDLDSLTPFIGPPLRDSFKKYYGFSDEQAWEGVQAYRDKGNAGSLKGGGKGAAGGHLQAGEICQEDTGAL